MTNKFTDLMLDLETAGMPPNGAILSIGAIWFDLDTQTTGPTFQQTIHLGSAVADGGTMDPGTFIFWLGQSDEARKAVRFGGRHIHTVLQDLSDFILETCRHEDVRIWANSPNFDLAILGGAYDRAGIKRPWNWSRERDFRTVRNMHPAVEYTYKDKGSNAHEALGDAKFQVEHLLKIKNHVSKGKTK